MLEKITQHVAFSCALLENGITCDFPPLISGRALDVLYGRENPGLDETWAQCEKEGCGKWRFIPREQQRLFDIRSRFFCQKIGLSCERRQVVEEYMIDYIVSCKVPQRKQPPKEKDASFRVGRAQEDLDSNYHTLMHRYLCCFLGRAYKEQHDHEERRTWIQSIEREMSGLGLKTKLQQINWLREQISAYRQSGQKQQRRTPTDVMDPGSDAAAAGKKPEHPSNRTLRRAAPEDSTKFILKIRRRDGGHASPPIPVPARRKRTAALRVHPRPLDLESEAHLPLKKRPSLRKTGAPGGGIG